MTTTTLPKAHSSIVEATELPRIIKVGDNLYATAFSLMKLLPARYIIDRAEAAGVLTPGTPVIETSSGTFALGLAMVCGLRGYPLTIVGDSAIDQELRTRLEMLGTTVEIVEHTGQPGGIQGARLARVAELCRQRPDAFVPGQYDNPDNPGAYGIVADLIDGTVGAVDCLVGPVGSGGSTGGLAGALRPRNPQLHLVGVDTHGSIIFGTPDAPRTLRGLGSSIHPGNVRHSAYDEAHWVTAAEAFHATHELYRSHGLFMGPTSGASFQVASWWAAQNPGSTVVMVLPDEGYRYQSTVYNDAWLREQGITPAPAPGGGPVTVEHPLDAPPVWSRLMWARRGFDDVMMPEMTS
ncbi:cystathionine beta-synthase [Streptomyces filipinensis]|uniref:Cystathionine beta-synthase n=1 Tax=Streptomyces filipinensis TaxID=66887 RepID=A0A918MGG5_9ACTN|nr:MULTISPECIES: PLP-dependent cysteine synthase family protein [Streptomyces]GGV30151.1 cystathionine beta-synthase [Streptomyces filipinensis]